MQQENQNTAGGEKTARLSTALREWVIAILIALLVALLLTQVVFVNAQVPSESMEDTIQVNDRVLGLRFVYLFEDPARYDIMIFHYPDDETQLYVKRVIGMPGEQLEIRDGLVYIDGQSTPLETGFVKGALRGNFGPYTIPEDCYFVMGDNRNESWDSRYWQNTFVRRERVVGRVWLRLFPSPGTIS
ncbi:signal peptidase I [Ruminococcaceae bacterium OttesenSCG-928-O06]|nr:signal peptidase I [Ruminococcaceae bacterium OttesenSCG-928-O06]